MRDRSRRMSEARSGLTGRVVDSYTNILTVKLFARARDEDAHVAEAVRDHNDAFRNHLRLMTGFSMTLTGLNAAMVVVYGFSIAGATLVVPAPATTSGPDGSGDSCSRCFIPVLVASALPPNPTMKWVP